MVHLFQPYEVPIFARCDSRFNSLDDQQINPLEVTGKHWSLDADTVLKAIGQTLALSDPALQTMALKSGRIAVDGEGRTSLAKVWAGGDCTYGGQDLTVEAVEHGKIAAHSIDRALATSPRAASFNRVRRTAA